MHAIFRLVVVGVLVIIQTTGIAQIKLPAMDYQPKSPAAAAFSRYGEIPVNISTGVPGIEIPLYKIKLGEMEVPLSISYHASGIKVRDVASEVGLGFSLNCGGAITVDILGTSDFDNNKSPDFTKAQDIQDAINDATTNGTTYDLAWDYWQRYFTNSFPRDLFSDRFYYSLPTGESGHFRKDYITDQIRLLPFNPVKIEMSYPDINVTAANGYKHYFKSITSSKDYFVLDKIETEDKTESIQYFYKTVYSQQISVQYTMDWRFENLIVDPYFPCQLKLKTAYDGYSYDYLSKSGNGVNPTTPVPDSVVSRNEVIIFHYATDRQDAWSHGYRLNKVDILSRQTRQVIKSYQFSQSYFGNSVDNNKRLRLDGITSAGTTATAVENYSFGYNSMALPKFPVLSEDIYHEDYWGYYNGSDNTNLLPSFFSTFGIPGAYNYADLSPHAGFTQACILTEINYPTGGKTKFEYEQNSSTDDYPAVLYGGVRVRKITSYTDATSQAFVKTYEYHGAEAKPIVPANYKYEQTSWVGLLGMMNPPDVGCNMVVGEYHKNVGLSNSLTPITIANGASIVYHNVTEYFGTETSNTGKIEYAYNFTDGEYRNPRPGNIDTRFFNQYHSDCGSYVPELASKSTFKFENGVYKIVNSEENTYSLFQQVEFNTGVNFGSNIEIGFENINCAGWQSFLTYHNLYNYLNTLVFTDTKGYQEASRLTTKVIKDYSSPSSYLTKTINYTYDNNYTLLKSESTITSEGKVSKNEFKYPFDFGSQTPYTTMTGRNILSPVIEQTESVDNVQTKKTIINYYSPFTDIFVPQTVEVKNGNHPQYTSATFNQYDLYGNILQMQKQDDVYQTYIWDYNNSYPIAHIINGQVANTAYTSFEADGKGGWSYSGATLSYGSCPTGRMRYLLSGGNITKSGLTNGNYTIAYWGTGSATVNGNGPTRTIRTINGWTYYEHDVTTTAITVAGINYIDELRLYPRGALMTTYTYEPLIGITSQCDANNRIVYYEYDNFHRLQLVRDQDGNVVKRICYNFHGQVENCAVSYKNDLVSQVFYPSCSPGYTSSGPYTYQVPAGTYTSTVSQWHANSLAQADINANGQTAANTNGCVSSCSYSTCMVQGEAYACVLGQCEQGVKVYTQCTYNWSTGMYDTIYHYEYSTGAWSQDYYQSTAWAPCFE